MTPKDPDDPDNENLFPPAPDFEADPEAERLLTRYVDQVSTEEILRRLVMGTGDLF